jgi:integrase/recombinase XerD
MVEQAVINEREHRRHRVLPVDDETLDMLKEYIDRGGTVGKNGHRLLFGLTREYAWLLVKTYASRAGLDQMVNRETGRVMGISPHRLRDAFAVHAIKHDDSGNGLRMLQEHLGHLSFNTTAKYRKVSGEEHREWYRKLWKKDNS